MNQATTPSSVSARPTVTHEEISRHAQELWEKYGRPAGRDQDIWLEAERNLEARQESSIQPAASGEQPTPATHASAPQATRPSAVSATARMPGGGRSGASRKR